MPIKRTAMKKIILLITLLGCVIALNAQETSTAKVDTSQMAKIVFDKTVYEYGTIAKGSEGTCIFKFSNRGKVPLLLSTVKAGCGCTTPSWSKEPIAPGKTGEISVKYNTSLLGPFSKSITVNSNSVTPAVVLIIKGEVK